MRHAVNLLRCASASTTQSRSQWLASSAARGAGDVYAGSLSARHLVDTVDRRGSYCAACLCVYREDGTSHTRHTLILQLAFGRRVRVPLPWALASRQPGQTGEPSPDEASHQYPLRGLIALHRPLCRDAAVIFQPENTKRQGQN